MTPAELNKLIRNTVAEHLGHDPATLNEDEELSDLGADSLDLVEIEMALAAELGLGDLDFMGDSETVNTLAEKLGRMEGVLG